MKKVYNSPELEINSIEVDDILLASGTGTIGDDNLGGMDEYVFPF